MNENSVTDVRYRLFIGTATATNGEKCFRISACPALGVDTVPAACAMETTFTNWGLAAPIIGEVLTIHEDEMMKASERLARGESVWLKQSQQGEALPYLKQTVLRLFSRLGA
jgi:hypothetical protein